MQRRAAASTDTPDVNFVSARSITLDAGNDDYILLDDTSKFDVASGRGLTISAWVKTGDESGCVVSLRNTSNENTVLDFCIGYNGSTTNDGHVIPLMRYDNATGLVQEGASARVDDNVWHHVSVIVDQPNNEMATYVDGVKYTTAQATDGSFTFSSDLSIGAEKYWIDGAAQTVDQRYLNGLIDDVRIYNRALTAAEVAYLAQGDQPQTGTGKYTIQDALNIDGDLVLATGTLDVNGQDINVQDSWLNYGGILEEETQSVTFDGGTSGHVIQSGSQTFYNLYVNGTSGGRTLYDDLEVTNTFNITDGTLTHSTDLPITEIKANTVINGGTFTGVASSIANVGNLTFSSGQLTTPSKFLTITENFSHSGGTLTASSGTILFSSDDTSNTIDQNGQAFNNVIIGDGLVGYWKLDETAEDNCSGGEDSCDSSGFGNHGTFGGDPVISTTLPRPFRFDNQRSVDFDGVGDYVDISDSQFDVPGHISVAAWAYIRTYPETDTIVSKAESSGYALEIGDDGFFQFAVHDGTGYIVADGNSVINTSQWYHLVGVWDGSNVKLYQNGILQTDAPAMTGSISTNDYALSIGSNPGASRSGFLNGIVDDVRLYNRALSEDEIKALAQAEVHGDNDNTYTLSDTLDADGDIILSKGTFITGGQDINVGGSWTNYDATYTGSTSSVTFDSTSGDQNIRSNSQTFYNIVLNNTDASSSTDDIILQDALDVDKDIAILDGDLQGGSYTLNVAGLWTMATAGTFTAGTSTVEFDDANKVTIVTGSTAFYDLLINTASKRVDFQAGTTTTVSNALTIDGQAAGTMVDLNSTSPGTQWTINTPTTTENVNFANIQDSVSANATLEALNSTDSLNNIFWFFGLIGGFDDAADGDWNACATWNKCPGTAIGVDYPGSVDEVTVDSHTVTITADASAKSIVISDDNETTDAVLVDGGYDLSVYGDITIEDATSILTSTGTWRQSANGSIAAPAGDLTSRINNYQILDGITSTMSDTVLVESLVLGTGSTLTGAQVLGILIDQNDPVDMIVGSSSISVESIWYMDNSSQTIQQKAFTATLGSFLYVASSGTIQMTGDWNIQENGVSADDGSLYLVGADSADESGSATLDTNGYNLSVDGFFEVGSDVTGDGSGRVYLRTGTHAIGENFKGSDTSALRGWIYMNSAIVNASGTVNFTNTTVSQGTGTVNFNATDTDNTITSWDQTFNDVVFNSATGGWTLSDGMMVSDDLTVTNTAAAGVSLAGYELTVGDNVTLTGGSLFANGSNFIVKSNLDSQAGTFEPGLSTVVLNGTDLDNTITTNAETFTNFSINDGLIGYWKFDDTASAAIDLSGYGNHAVWQDAATNGTAAPDLNFVNLYSLSMDGVDDFARIESPRYSFDKAGSYTWAGWIYLDNACSGGYCTIISQSPDGGDGYSLEIENDPNSLGLYGQGYYYAASNLSYDRWYHFALTYDNGTVVVHINGVIQAEDSSDATEFVSY